MEDHGEGWSWIWGTRCILGGVLMGLANLVPGISGGTMLLAAGVYPRFIEALADLSSLRLRREPILVLALIVGAALVAILLGAGVVKNAVIENRWAMYSLFIGLTLGGVPVLWRMASPATGRFLVGAVVGLVAMIALAYTQAYGDASGASREGPFIMFAAGMAGASAMILPGVSGGYLLLILGVYVPVLTGIDHLKEAIRSGDIASATAPILQVVLPVGIGVGVGVLVVSNVIKVVLHRYEQSTLGVLMGLLIGAVFGLWPFQQGVAPKVGDLFKGEIMTTEAAAALEPDKYPTVFYRPDPLDVITALGLVVLGYVITTAVARTGRAR